MYKIFLHIVIFYFSIGALIPGADFSQLSKLPELYSHYVVHLNEEKSSFLEFVVVHYFDLSEHQSDQPHDHHKLPFQNINSCLSWLPPQQIPELFFADRALVLSSGTPAFQNSFHLKGFGHTIFQPPALG